MQIILSAKEKVLLENLNVDALILFGSQAQGLEVETSDFDFGVLISDTTLLFSHEMRSKIYDAIYDLLSSKIERLVNIDIVFLYDAPMELRSHVAKHGVVVYERTPYIFARFREHTMDMYADFAPLRYMFHRAILSRISSE